MARIVVTGLEEAMANLKRMGADVGEDARVALEKVGQHLENKIEIKLSHRGGPRTGRVYKTGKKGTRYEEHQASAPGEPPAKLSGLLMGSITHRAERTGKTRAEGAVGTNVEYAEDLERGTSKVAPRPFMLPTITEEAKAVSRIIKKSLGTALKRYEIK